MSTDPEQRRGRLIENVDKADVLSWKQRPDRCRQLPDPLRATITLSVTQKLTEQTRVDVLYQLHLIYNTQGIFRRNFRTAQARGSVGRSPTEAETHCHLP